MQRRIFNGGGRGRNAPGSIAGWAALGCIGAAVLLGHGQQAHAGEPATPAGAARWVSVEKGVIEDTRTGLQWTAADNGADIDWNAAKAWCVSKRFRWRLPTLLELLSLYVAPGEGASGVACGASTCRAYVEFKLSGSWFWSATPVGQDAYDGIEMAWGVQLINGAKTQTVMDLSEGSRALCVRNR